MFKIAVLISGNGSNLEALIDACKKNVINGSIDIVISNNPDAYGIQRAKNHSINYKIIDNNRFETREDFDQALVEELKDSNPNLIVLAGFMRILSSVMTEAFRNKIINIHPSLLPKYPGLDTHNSVIKNGDLNHGITIHFVNEVLDGGQIIAQGEISVNANETSEELKTRIHAIEHVMLPKVVSKFADGTINTKRVIYEKFK
jgi:phosphoribosylglycinamide formyltransferase-1